MVGGRTSFVVPPLDVLEVNRRERAPIDKEAFLSTAEKLTAKLRDFGIEGEVVEIRPGPVVTMYEFKPAAGVKISRIASLSDDLAMAMEAMRVRIVAPIPGKGVVGIEVPMTHAKTEKTVEKMTMELTSDAKKLGTGTFSIAWGTHQVTAPGHAPQLMQRTTTRLKIAMLLTGQKERGGGRFPIRQGSHRLFRLWRSDRYRWYRRSGSISVPGIGWFCGWAADRGTKQDNDRGQGHPVACHFAEVMPVKVSMTSPSTTSSAAV